jgi:hypothetical protein
MPGEPRPTCVARGDALGTAGGVDGTVEGKAAVDGVRDSGRQSGLWEGRGQLWTAGNWKLNIGWVLSRTV